MSQNWTLLTNHGHVLIYVHRNPEARIRDIAAAVGVTERSAQAILADLTDAGYVKKKRVGRRNVYSVNVRRRFRHPQESGHQVGGLLDLFGEDQS